MKLGVVTAIAVMFAGCERPSEQRAVTGVSLDTDGSAADVQAKHNQAQTGDTIKMPQGTFTWATRVSFTKAVTLQGAGIGQTVVKDGIQASGGSGQLLYWTLPAGLSRLTGIEFQDGGRPQVQPAPHGIIRVDGSNTNGSQFRMDHCKWQDLNGFFVPNTVIGVIDHNVINIGGPVYEWMYPYGNNWNNKTYGDGSWDSAVSWGSSQFLFLEDNTGYCSRTSIQCSLSDGFNGARFVVRHNDFSQSNFNIGDHGTESPGRGRSSRAKEIYDNKLGGRNVNKYPIGTRGGTVLTFNNTLTNYQGAAALNALSSYRMVEDFNPWGGADGDNKWDKNNTGNPFATITASAVSGRTVTVSGVSWSPNQWAGHTLHRTQGANTDFAYIDSSTNNTVTYRSGGYGRDMVVAVGDTFKINKVDASLDQTGAGISAPFTGDNPTPPPSFTQGKDPCYSWNNTNDGQPWNNFSPSTSNIKQGVDYFNNTAKPSYTPYTYPHPLVTGGGTPAPTVSPLPTSPTPAPTAVPVPSTTITATPSPSGAGPIPPSNLTAVSVDGTTVKLDWQDNSTDEDRFFIRNSTDGTNYGLYDTTNPNVTTYTGRLLAGHYFFKVQAHGDAGYGDFSNVVEVTMGAPVVSPSPSLTPAPTATVAPTATATVAPTPTPSPIPTATAAPSSTPITMILHEGDVLNIYVRPKPTP